MGRVLLWAGLFLGALITAAEARTLRYEFDVVGTRMSFDSLIDRGPSGDRYIDIFSSNPTYQKIVAASHPLGFAHGRTTGHVVLDVHESPNASWNPSNTTEPAPFQCHVGFLCSTFDRMNQTYVPFYRPQDDGFSIYAWNASGEWYLDTRNSIAGMGSLGFTDDLGSVPFTLNGVQYLRGTAGASFTLANLTITDVTGQAYIVPTPLPATAWLFAPLGLLLFRRRRR